jgi:hypothetical protein
MEGAIRRVPENSQIQIYSLSQRSEKDPDYQKLEEAAKQADAQAKPVETHFRSRSSISTPKY